jgi:uncharacterized protein
MLECADHGPSGRYAMALRLDLTSLKPGHTRLHLDAEPASLGLPGDNWTAPIELELAVDRAGDQLVVSGRGHTATDEECARCLRRGSSPLEFEIDLHADRTGSGGRIERELAADDYVVFHDGRALELGDEVREAALLAQPMAPLCRPDCRGLCPRCGVDLNEEPGHQHTAP